MPTLDAMLRVLGWGFRALGIRRKAFRRDDIAISYLEGGRKDAEQTLVLVHGLGSSGFSWTKVLLPLAREFRVLAPDLPGWGHSPLPRGQDHATIHDLMLGLTRFLEHVPGRSVVLVGQSLGGWVSAKVAATRPELVRHLVLCNSAGVLYPEVAELRTKLDVKTRDQVERFWSDLYHRVPRFYRFFTDDYVARMHEPRILNFFESVKEESAFVNEDLSRITMPTTVIWGRSDRFIPSHTVDVLVAGLPNVNVYWIPDCGHIPALERPKEFVRVLRARLLPIQPSRRRKAGRDATREEGPRVAPAEGAAVPTSA